MLEMVCVPSRWKGIRRITPPLGNWSLQRPRGGMMRSRWLLYGQKIVTRRFARATRSVNQMPGIGEIRGMRPGHPGYVRTDAPKETAMKALGVALGSFGFYLTLIVCVRVAARLECWIDRAAERLAQGTDEATTVRRSVHRMEARE